MTWSMENQNGGEGLHVSQLAADARDHLVPKSRLVGSGEGWMEQGSLTARWGGGADERQAHA